jgi:hypothetical protein
LRESWRHMGCCKERVFREKDVGGFLFLIERASASVGALLRSVASLAPGATRAPSTCEAIEGLYSELAVRAFERPMANSSPGHSPGLFLHLLLNTTAHVRASLLF